MRQGHTAWFAAQKAKRAAAVKNRATCSTFLLQEDLIVETFHTDWQEVEPGGWRLTDDVTLRAHVPANGLVVELPIGCIQIPIDPLEPGNTITLQRIAGRGLWYPCEFPRRMPPPTRRVE